MGNYPSMGTKGGTVIGGLELNISYSYMPCCGGPWYNCCTFAIESTCCKGFQAPTGPEWEKAKDGFAPFLEEGAAIAFKSGAPLSCVQGGRVQCGCMDVFKAKAALDADWTNRANTYLADHGLQVEVCAFYTSAGEGGAYPRLFIQFSKTA